MNRAPTVGVEEELFVVDDVTGGLSARAAEVIAVATHRDDDQIDHELSRAQVETGSAVCADLASLGASLTSLRRRLDAAARSRGAQVLATGTHPSSPWQQAGGVTDDVAYRKLAADPELAIQVMNRVRLDIPVLLALSANSPFWAGVDTRYASYRTEIFHRWPTTGLPEPFASRAEYDTLVETLHVVDAIDAPARLYWDLRPSARYPTLELRIADVPLTVPESVTVAGLFRPLRAGGRSARRPGARLPPGGGGARRPAGPAPAAPGGAGRRRGRRGRGGPGPCRGHRPRAPAPGPRPPGLARGRDRDDRRRDRALVSRPSRRSARGHGR